MNLFERISLWWKFEGRYYHKDFTNGIKNLIRWFPVIWKDRDWDQNFIWNLMIQKMKFQSKYIGNRDFHVNAKRDAEIMLLCVRLMEKIKNDDYETEHLDYIRSNHEFIPVDKDESGEDLFEIKSTVLEDNLDEYFKKYPLVYKRVSQKCPDIEDKQIVGLYMGMENHNRAIRILFTLMERNIERWWD